MAENKITIHQAFYGEVNRAHSCIKQTVTDPDLTSFLITFTDRPAALPPGVNLLPYLSGSSFAEYYILTKTFSDSTATRAGMVFTHVLILNQTDIVSINNLQNLLSLFVESTDNKNDELKAFLIEISDSNFKLADKLQPKYIQEVIAAFIAGINPILFSGDISTFSNALQQIWNSPNIGFRKKLKFRTSFTLSDIENIKDLSIVSIQPDFLPKWQGQKIIQGLNQESIEITSHSEALFLGFKEESPFHDFLIELNANLGEVQSYGQYEKIFINYISIDKMDDANVLRQDIRVLSKISPSPSNGKTIKEKFIERLSTLLETKKDNNIKALRNVDWSAFMNGENTAKRIVSSYVSSEISNPNLKNFETLLDIIALSVTDEEKNWWHYSITEAIRNEFERQSEISVKNIWKLIDLSEVRVIYIILIVGSIKDCERILRTFLPDKLRVETCDYLAKTALKKNWYLFYADILLKQLSIEDALEEQLKIEDKIGLANSVGVNYLAQKLSKNKLIDLTLKSCDKKLIDLAVEAIIADVSLISNININVSCWLDIWTSFVLSTGRVFDGLKGKEQTIAFSVLDLLINGKLVNEVLVGLIIDQNLDISEYPNRSKVWGVVNHLHKEKLLETTTQSVLKKLVLGKIDISSIEMQISSRIASDDFMTKFLSENRNDIGPVLVLFEGFKNLKDNFLADYIFYYKGTISENQAKKLGNIVAIYKFRKSARSIYDKAKHDNTFNPAYNRCKDLVTFNWWEFSKIGKPLHEPYKHEQQMFTNFNGEQLDRNQLPTVVILTAIKEEYSAVKRHLKEIVDADQNDTSYEAGIFSHNDKEVAKVIIRECGARNTNAAQETERAIQYFKPHVILFVGIAGSRKPKDFGVGDVIFPEKVYSYEGGKAEKDSFLARPDNAFMSYTLMEKAKKERNKDDWKKLIKGQWSVEVKADIGVIASGEQVVEHYNSSIGKILHSHYNDTSAVEMEGFGFGKAANRQGRETSNILIGVVRGISDIIEQPSKSKNNKTDDRRPTNAKELASDTAAAFAFWLIFKTYNL